MPRRLGQRVRGYTPIQNGTANVCPRCGAARGWRCGRYVSQDGVKVWKPNKTIHPERRGH